MPEAPDPHPIPHTWKVAASTFSAYPQHGARLAEWSLALAGARRRQVIYWPDHVSPDTELAKVRGGNPVLFPFSGRSFHHGVADHWKSPDRSIRSMPRHGFARGSPFELVAISENGFRARLIITPEAEQCYPFEYDFYLEYVFEELSLQVALELHNEGRAPIPWSPGHHFYFTLPWHDNAKRENYELNLPARKSFYQGPDGKLVPGEPLLARDLPNLADPRLNDCIHTNLRLSELDIGPRGGEEFVRLRFLETPVPLAQCAVVTWTESDESPFYCVEPWMGPPNAVEHGRGLYWVAPGETCRFVVEVLLY